jgi:hypothetical protein
MRIVAVVSYSGQFQFALIGGGQQPFVASRKADETREGDIGGLH